MEAIPDAFNLLADSRRRDYLNYGVKLYKAAMIGDWGAAAMIGDWGAAAKIHETHLNCFTERITKQGATALHIAAVAKRSDFVAKLVPLMADSNSLGLITTNGNTALSFAAASGTVASARAMVEAQGDLPMIRNNGGLTPLHMAALVGHRDMVVYLLPLTNQHLSLEEWGSLFISTINTDLYDIALRIIGIHPYLANARDDRSTETPLHVLAKKSHKSSQIPRGFWNRCFNRCKEEKASEMKLELVKQLWEIVMQETQDDISELMTSPWRLLFGAVEVGNVEFVTTLINHYPDLLWKLDDKGQSIFHVAVQFRQESIFRLIFEIGAIKDLLVTYVREDTYDNILHLAALLPASDRLNCISGAALQMQREMLWFKVVEDIVHPQLAEARNIQGKTARDLFTEQHTELRKEGEEWLRKTGGSCSVVATLIAGVVFGAALNKIPEGQGGWHWLFSFSISLSLISSTASILMFLSIMTSRYAENDFLRSLPLKLMIGLTLLFISIATMMIAFTATFEIIFKHGLLWTLIAVLACIPIFLFALQEFPLLLEVFRSTIGSNYIFKPRHQLFCTHSLID